MVDTSGRSRRGAMQIPRSRGAVSGLLIVALGVWGALAPFVGPLFDFAFTPDRPWAWTQGRGWLEVLPGLVAVFGGLLLFVSRNRATAMLGGWLAVAAGAWFVVGRAVAGPLGLGGAGQPVADSETKQVWLELTYFSGLGALIVFLAALAVGRLSVRTARDIAYREARVDTAEPHPVTDGTAGWNQPDAAGEPTRRRHGLFGRRRGSGDRTTLPV
ncbi:hypothetical protein [Mycolicibacterium sp. D5.8-2]|uniref:hypothetical protein n=1 Tax=Mycolicibacterium sp. D5.8-2 TaxID=3085903 RepID=UPI00298C9A75|nr:hypothetical protein [Mycolicibacterium sp. D5.8-2]MDW5613679.1 hypothetical protein [Mycolicibacterium sp. D5.8-2]